MNNGNADTAQSLDTRKYRLRWWTLLALSVSLIVIALDTTILNVAIPTLQGELNASASALQWIVASYVLVFAGLLLTMGSLGDRFGRRFLLQTGIVVFGLASLGAAYSQTSTQLIMTRAVMGLGGAMIMPATLSIIVDVFPREERARAIGIWAAVAGIGVPLGMVTGGWLLEQFWWGSVFLVNIPVAGAVIIASLFVIPESRDPVAHRIDVVGAVLSTGALSTLVYGVIEAPGTGWLAPGVVSAFVVAVVLGVAFVVFELRAREPMLDIRLFKNRRLSSGAAAISISFFVMLGAIFLVTQWLQFVEGYSPLEAGIRMVPMALGFMVGAATSDKLVARLGTKIVLTGGLIGIALGLTQLAFLDVGTAYWPIGVALFTVGIGMGATMAPATDAVMGSVPEENAGVGSALNDVTRNVGGALGIGVIGSVFNSIYGSQVASAVTALPVEAAALAQNSIGAAKQIAIQMGGPAGNLLLTEANGAFDRGFDVAMAVGIGLLAVGALMTIRFMPSRETQQEEALDIGLVVEGLVLEPIPIDE